MGNNLAERNFDKIWRSTGRITTATTATPTTKDCVIHSVSWNATASPGLLTVTALSTSQVVCVASNISISDDQRYDVFCPGGFSYTTTGTSPDFTIQYKEI